MEAESDASLPGDTSMIDMVVVEAVEIEIDKNGTVWVNVDGLCRFRAHRCKTIQVRYNGQPLLDGQFTETAGHRREIPDELAKAEQKDGLYERGLDDGLAK